MSQIVIRTDKETEAVLAHLVELTGQNRSEVVRDAIRNAERQAVLARLQAQAKRVRDDAADRAEMLGLADEMEQLRAW